MKSLAAGAIAIGLIIAVGLLSTSRGANRYADADSLYAALRQQPHTRLSFGGAEIDVVFADGAPGLAPLAERSQLFELRL